ncbi:MAG: ATP-binding cassette domain-containing protein [Parcubacteria group bacterium]|nr:ATP-binding cassette domain-containing protein [Parcubacteria group bacterium]MCR4343016.1 ATP-binding cassette domain-containing protein [Patescibacteria group bacterium]
MAKNEVIIRFDDVSFEYGHNNPILDEVSFPIRRGSKITLMGQNGAGKSTIFRLVEGELKPESGSIHIAPRVSIASSKQVIPREEMDLTIREFFEKRFQEKVYDIDPRIDAVLDVVNLNIPHKRIVKSFSGGQQARLLMAGALIQNPDILLLDEPTNNLDKEGIAHLTKFLIDYKKTCIVISHDADFLNAFTHGVLYLDVFTRKVEQYVGNYFDLVAEISAKIEKENKKNAQLAKEIQENKDKANFFANKGGQMRLVAKKMREKAEEMEEAKVDVRKEDRTIRSFAIPCQPDIVGEILNISSYNVIKNHKPAEHKAKISLKKNQHLLLTGPNGIGKSTLLEVIASWKAKGAKIMQGVKVGYYRQDFSTLNFEDTVYEALASVMEKVVEENLRAVASGFLIGDDIINVKIGRLSEGQKGLVAFAQLVLQKPGLLILDEPTNHINFRHIPVIANALNRYEGAMVLVSHVPEFVSQIRIDETLDLSK